MGEAGIDAYFASSNVPLQIIVDNVELFELQAKVTWVLLLCSRGRQPDIGKKW